MKNEKILEWSGADRKRMEWSGGEIVE